MKEAKITNKADLAIASIVMQSAANCATDGTRRKRYMDLAKKFAMYEWGLTDCPITTDEVEAVRLIVARTAPLN